MTCFLLFMPTGKPLNYFNIALPSVSTVSASVGDTHPFKPIMVARRVINTNAACHPERSEGTKPVSSLRKTSMLSVFLVRNDKLSFIHADGQTS